MSRTTHLMLMSLALLVSFASTALAETYKVDPVHSMIVFHIGHLGVSHIYGRFDGPTGTIEFDPAHPDKATFHVQVEAKDVDTANPDRDKDLRSGHFLSADQFPTISFQSKSVKKTGDNTYEVAGDVTLHGVTKPLTVTLTNTGSAKDPWGGYRTGFETTFTVKRSDFGMSYMLPGVGDEVTLLINLEGVKQ